MRLTRLLLVLGSLALLTGCVKARLQPSIPQHAFGEVLVGSNKRIAQPANWQNTGQRAARITGLTIGGSEAASFAAEPVLMRARVAPAEQSPALQAVTFTPARIGGHNATVGPTTADSEDQVTPIGLSGEGKYIIQHQSLTVIEPGGPAPVLPDPDKPLDCGRIAYTTSSTCTFTVRNDSANPLAVLVAIQPGSAGNAFRVTAPTSPPNPPVVIAPNATLTVTVTFSPPSMTPGEWMFMGGITVLSGPVQAGRTVCGVGFRQPETPPPPPVPAPLTCR